MFTVEDNIPLPSKAARNARYPYETMEVGQSFFVAIDESIEDRDEAMHKLARRMSGASAAAAKRTGKTFRTGKASKDGKIGYRVWRAA